MRFVFVILICLLSSLRVWTGPNPGIFGKISFDAHSPSAEIVLGTGGTIQAESSIYLSLEEFGIGCWHFAMDTANGEIFMGSGAIDGGFALRTKPFANPAAPPATLWTAKRGENASSRVFGTASGGLVFFMLSEPKGAVESISTADLSALYEESLRFGGLEYTTQIGELTAGVAVSLADRPRSPSGDGWRAGESFEHGATHFVLSSATSVRRRGILAGLWASGCGGYLESPGWAASLGFEAKVGHKNTQPAFTLNTFLFGSSATYIAPGGESAFYDFFADAQASIRIKPWSLTTRWVAISLTNPGISAGKRPLLNSAVPVFDLLPWLWKLDIMKSSLNLGFDTFSLAARLTADEYGLSNGFLSLRCSDITGKAETGAANGPTIGAAINGRFTRNGGSTIETSDETDEEIGGESIIESETQSMPGISDGLNFSGLRLEAIDFELSIAWEGIEGSIFRTGKIQILIASKNMSEGAPELALSGSIAQKFRIGAAGEVSFAIKCPKGGYCLDAAAQGFPLLELEFSIELSSARRRFPKPDSASIVKVP
ncbi:MAG: hypothetical protein CVV53_03630 [Spirochaetae bacterium HGW-Spirochaetae-9]|nr:MAG: hypothetical protein CVV53_03630 [Spirochaetae bacterium HGW-Spirochaetae-9]